MAEKYVDFDGGSDASSGNDWANAYLTVQKGLTDALAGGQVFVKTDSAGTNKDTAAADRTLTSPGTIGNPTSIFGCKNGTTNEPPADADLVSRGDTDIPVYETTVNSSDITLAGYANVYGMKLSAASGLFSVNNANIGWVFQNSTLGISNAGATNKEIIIGNTGATARDDLFWLKDSEIILGSVSSHLRPVKGGRLVWHGGVLTAASGTTKLFDGTFEGSAEIRGVDLSAMGSSKTLVDVAGLKGADILAVNCKIGASLALVTGTWTGWSGRVRMHGCSTATGLGSGASVRDFSEATYQGDVTLETTAVRTGGASDKASGGHAYKMTPNANATLEPFNALVSPPIIGWIEGDGTAKTLTIYIANSAASTDYDDDEVWAEFFFPDAAGTAQHDYNIERMTPLATAAVQTDDTGSTWGSGGNSPQKLVATLSAANSPDYQGPVVGFVFVAKRQATPDSVYVDPLIEVT